MARTTLIPFDEERRFPIDTEGLPKPVKRANVAAHEAFTAYNAACQERDRLVAEVEIAPKIDRREAAVAAAAGKDMPPLTLPQKQAALADAERRVEALKALAIEATWALYDAVGDNYGEFIAERERRAEDAAESMLADLDALIDKIAVFRRENALYQHARAFRKQPQSVPLSQRDASAAEVRQFKKAVAERRNHVGMRRWSPAHPDVKSLVAALAVEMEYELAGTPYARRERPRPQEMAGRVRAAEVEQEKAAA